MIDNTFAKLCEQCGMAFRTGDNRRQYCSAKCRINHGINLRRYTDRRLNVHQEDMQQLNMLRDDLDISKEKLLRIAVRLFVSLYEKGKIDPVKLGKKWEIIK